MATETEKKLTKFEQSCQAASAANRKALEDFKDSFADMAKALDDKQKSTLVIVEKFQLEMQKKIASLVTKVEFDKQSLRFNDYASFQMFDMLR